MLTSAENEKINQQLHRVQGGENVSPSTEDDSGGIKAKEEWNPILEQGRQRRYDFQRGRVLMEESNAEEMMYDDGTGEIGKKDNGEEVLERGLLLDYEITAMDRNVTSGVKEGWKLNITDSFNLMNDSISNSNSNSDSKENEMIAESALKAAERLSGYLLSDMAAQKEPQPLYEAYGTTLFLILTLHFIFWKQWKSKRSKRDVAVSYNHLVKRKQFHRGLIALLSHPPHDGATNTTRPPIRREDNDGSAPSEPNPSISSRTVELGTDDVADNGRTRSQTRSRTTRANSWLAACNNARFRITQTLRRILTILLPRQVRHSRTFLILRSIYHFLPRILCSTFYRLYSGDLAGLPLLTYISHILWQCRALEELFDFQHDHPHFSIHELDDNHIDDPDKKEWYNLLLDEKSVVRFVYPFSFHNSSQHGEYHTEDTTQLPLHVPIYAYYRVLLTLALTSLLIELYGTHSLIQFLYCHDKSDNRFIVHHWNNTPPPPGSPEATAATATAAGTSTGRINLEKRGICTLTPLCSAILVVYQAHFSYVPLSIFPFLPLLSSNPATTEPISSTNASVSILSCLILLAILSYRVYPLTGVWHGMMSGWLWCYGGNVTKFLGDEYWGRFLSLGIVLACIFSWKASSCGDASATAASGSDPSGGGNSGSHRTYRRGTNWIPWCDYVNWDEYGRIGGTGAYSNREEGDGMEMHQYSTSTARRRTLFREQSRTGDDLRGEEERRPLLGTASVSSLIRNVTNTSGVGSAATNSNSTTDGASGTSSIRGRLPLSSLDSELERGGDVSPEVRNGANTDGFGSASSLGSPGLGPLNRRGSSSRR